MLLCFILLNVLHPGLVLRGPESDFPRISRKEKKALKREKKEAKKQAKMDRKSEKKQRRTDKTNPSRGWHHIDLESIEQRGTDHDNLPSGMEPGRSSQDSLRRNRDMHV